MTLSSSFRLLIRRLSTGGTADSNAEFLNEVREFMKKHKDGAVSMSPEDPKSVGKSIAEAVHNNDGFYKVLGLGLVVICTSVGAIWSQVSSIVLFLPNLTEHRGQEIGHFQRLCQCKPLEIDGGCWSHRGKVGGKLYH